MRALVPLIGRHEGDVPSVQPGAEASGAQADLPASFLVLPRPAVAEDVHAPVVLAWRCLESSLFSRSLPNSGERPRP